MLKIGKLTKNGQTSGCLESVIGVIGRKGESNVHHLPWHDRSNEFIQRQDAL